jgi:hypothetical protein
MLLVVDKSKNNEKRYKLFYKKEDISSSILNSNVEIIEIEPTLVTVPNKEKRGFYGC